MNSLKTKLIIVRHAEAVGNAIREFHGWTDSNITEKGHVQAAQVAERLKSVPIDVIYSSPLKRTMETAKYISKVKGLPIIQRDDLKEINGGLWEGMTWTDLVKVYPEEYTVWEEKPHAHQMPEGESMKGLQQRLINAFSDIIKKEEGKNVCIVTHGTALRTLMCWFLDCGLEDIVKIPWCDNTAVTTVTFENGRFTVELDGDACHLDGESSTIKNQEWYVEYKNKFFSQE
jgi:probable phosphoglycerate mutase